MLMNMTLMMMLLDQWRTSTRNLEEQEGMESRPNVFYSSGNCFRNSILKTFSSVNHLNIIKEVDKDFHFEFFAFFISPSIFYDFF